MPVNYLIYIKPQLNKAGRCAEVLEWLTGEVKANEPDVYAYFVRETGDWSSEAERTFFVHMVIKDEKALAERAQLPHHGQLAKILKEEQLVTELKYLKMSHPPMGFMREDYKAAMAKGEA